MSNFAETQFFYRLPKSLKISSGNPNYNISDVSESSIKTAVYSPNGQYFAYTLTDCVVVLDPDTQNEVSRLEAKDVYDLHFSPSGTFLAVYEKPIRTVLEDKNVNWSKNVRVFNVKSAICFAEFTAKVQGGWKPQFSADEKYLAKLYPNGVRFYDISNSTPIDFHKPTMLFEGDNISTYALSPGKNPSIAIFNPEKSGKPAAVKVYTLSVSGFRQPLCQKQFFKAERCILKWNALGTAILALASTDVDSSNKSYYGESALYLLGIAGSFNSRITLDKEAGPIHDICWSPSSREFGVIYGYMPSQTSFFDARGNLINSLPPSARNTILFSPHAKFVLVAGFGNLQGTVDIYDRTKKFAKVCSFEASNTSVCHWSPDGRYIMTATTSPRLRVDNGIKIWHASGKLCYIQEFSELLAVNWRPQAISKFPALKSLESDYVLHSSAIEFAKKSASKPDSDSKPKTGAYRPPHARNNGVSAAKTLYETEMSARLNGTYKAPVPRQRVIPGAPIPVATESKRAAKNRKKREAKKGSNDESEETSAKETTPEAGVVFGGVVSAEEKTIRKLSKKLRAIEQLKMKQAQGEFLEDTQVMKIATEAKIREELQQLGWKEGDDE